MNFCSLDFIFIFLPVFVLVHGLIPSRLKNAVLFAGSLLFYYLASGGIYSFAWLIISTLGNYLAGVLIGSSKKELKTGIFIMGVTANVSALLLFKYFKPVVSAFSALTPDSISALNVVLPLGFSFYIFKCISYLHQVYSGKVKAELSFIDFGAYVTLFPQVTMGPIQTYYDFRPALKRRTVTVAKINEGLYEFILGFGLKMIFANRLAAVWNGVETIGYDSVSTPLAWIGVLAFTLQLYFDFYGYSLMSKGIGMMLGYMTPDNFTHPYMSRSVSEFWRRWHMTLGEWFKENIYFPLGGSKCSKAKTIRNMFVVWLFTGIWHGDSINYIIWGMFLFVLIVLERQKFMKPILKFNVTSRIYTVFFIFMSWMIFKVPTLDGIAVYLSRMFPFFTETPEFVFADDWVRYVKGLGTLMASGVVFTTPLPRMIYKKLKKYKAVIIPVMLCIFWYAVYLSATGENNPFLYVNY